MQTNLLPIRYRENDLSKTEKPVGRKFLVFSSMNHIKQHMRYLLLCLYFFVGNFAFGQALPDLDQVKMEKKTDFKKAEPFVQMTANYLLSTPIKKDDPNRRKAVEFVIKWVAETPDFSLKVSDYTEITKGDQELVGIYFAALTKYILENRSEATDLKKVKLNTILLMLTYCENKNNNIRMNKNFKKYAEARDKGTLEKMLE